MTGKITPQARDSLSVVRFSTTTRVESVNPTITGSYLMTAQSGGLSRIIIYAFYLCSGNIANNHDYDVLVATNIAFIIVVVVCSSITIQLIIL